MVKALSESTLTKAFERLVEELNVSVGQIDSYLVVKMFKISESVEGARILRWLREQSKLATMLALSDDNEMVKEALSEVELPEADKAGVMPPRNQFDIGIRVECESALSHGSDNKAGNATLFRRMQVIATNGETLLLPYYAGNALRGQIRDLLADHFLNAIGLSRSDKKVTLWFFYALYSGGMLEEKSDATKAIKKLLGDSGSIRSDGIRRFRDMLPALSLLGCALGNRVLPGHCQFADLRPVCREWGTGDKAVSELFSWEFLTRREDREEHDEHHGMIANTEVLRSGTALGGGIDMDSAMPKIEHAALSRGLLLLQQRGMLGAENRRGLGRVRVDYERLPEPDIYDSFLSERRSEILDFLSELDALCMQLI